MTQSPRENQSVDRLSLADRIDLLCDAFERDWIAGRSPRLEDYLERIEHADRDALFGELLKVELEHRRRRGDSVDAGEFERRFPKYVRRICGEFSESPSAVSSVAPAEATEASTAFSDATFALGSDNQAAATARAGKRPESARDFLKRLVESRMLDESSLDAAAKLAADVSSTAQSVAGQLVERRLLTNWQARALLAGRTTFFFGKYKLLEQLGRGGMGVVFRAVDVRLQRPVALKVMSRRLVDKPEAVARFRREISAAAALDHPNIVLAYDADCVKGVHFLVMEYVDGDDLSAVGRREGPLPVHLACDYVRQAALGLQHAHERGLVHRDIKPSNLLLTRGVPRDADDDTHLERSAFLARPRVKVLDFGLARYTSELSADGGITATGQTLGTPDYVAPEQAQDVTKADIRSDIYSLGCTLFRLLAGRSPFVGSSPMEVLMARVLTDAPRLRSVRPDVSPELDDVVARMLHRDPGRRFQTPREVAEALVPFCRPDSSAWKDVRPRETLTPAESAIESDVEVTHAALARDPQFAQFVDALATVAEDAPPADGDRPSGPSVTSSDTKPARRTSRVLRDYDARIHRDRRRVLWAVAVLVAFGALWAAFGVWWSAGETRLVVDWPIEEREAATLEVNGRSQEIPDDPLLVFPGRPGHLTLRMTRTGYHPIEESWDLARGEELVFRPEWSPTTDTARKLEWETLRSDAGRTIAAAAANGWDADRKEVVDEANRLLAFRRKWPRTPESLQAATLRAELPSPFDALKFSGERPGIKLSKNLELVAVVGDPRWQLWGYHVQSSLSPDGKFVATGTSAYVTIWDTETGRVRHRFDGWGGVAFHPDGERLAYNAFTDRGQGIIYYDLKQERSIKRFPISWTWGVPCLAFSPDGRQLLVCNRNRSDPKQYLMILDVNTGKLLYELPGHERHPWSAVWSPKGDMIASWDDGGNCRLWRLKAGKWTSSVFPGRHQTFRFSPDGQLLAGCDRQEGLRVWDVSGATPIELSRLRQRYTMCCVWHPDGRSLLFTKAGEIHQVRRSDGKVIPRLPIEKRDDERALRFDHEGKKLLLANYYSLRLWDFPTRKELLPNAESIGLISHLNVMSGGREIRAQNSWLGGSADWKLAAGKVRFLERASGERMWTIVSTDGSSHSVVLADGTIRLERPGMDPLVLSRKAQILTLRQPARDVVQAFDSLGSTLAVGGERNRLLLIETATGRLIKSFGSLQSPISAVCFSPDGKRVAVGTTAGTIIAWRIQRGIEIGRLTMPDQTIIRAMAFVGNGNKLFFGGATAGVIDLNRSKVDREIPVRTCIAASASTDQRLMVTIHVGGRGRIWRLPEMTGIAEFTVGDHMEPFRPNFPRNLVYSVALAPDNRHILTDNTNGTVYVLRIRRTPKSP